MANGDPIDMSKLNLADPQTLIANAKRGGAPQQSQRRPVGGLDALVNTFANIEDPFARSLAKGLVETELSRATGFKVSIPDPEDMEMMAAAREIEMGKMRKELAQSTVEEAKATLLDLSPSDAAKVGLAGVDVDNLLESNPDLFINAAQRAGFTQMTRGTLTRAAIKDTDTASAGPAFQQEQAKKQVDVLQTQASGIEAATKVAKEGPKVYEAGAQAAYESAGEALGVDVDPFFGNPLSSDKGALAFLDATQQIGRKGPAFSGKTAEALITRNADDIGGALEDLPITQDGLIQVVPGKGEAQKANGLYVALGVLNAAKMSGTNITDIFAQIPDLADKAVGFDGASLDAAIQAEVKRLGPEGSKPLRGLVESLFGG